MIPLQMLAPFVQLGGPSVRLNFPVSWEITPLSNESLEATSDTEMKARFRGVVSQMITFGFFGLLLFMSEKIMRYTDALSRTLL